MYFKDLILATSLVITPVVAMEEKDAFSFPHPFSQQTNHSDDCALDNPFSSLTVTQQSVHDVEVDKLIESMTNLTTAKPFHVDFSHTSTFSSEIRDSIQGIFRTHGLGDILEEIGKIKQGMHLEMVVRFLPKSSKEEKTLGHKRRCDFDQMANKWKQARVDEEQNEVSPSEDSSELDSMPYRSGFSGRIMTNKYLYRDLTQEQGRQLRGIIYSQKIKEMTTAIANLFPQEKNARVHCQLVR